MKSTKLIWTAPLAAAIALGGCASQTPYSGSETAGTSSSRTYPSQTQGQVGYVDKIEVINKGSSGSNIMGTVIGGVVGGLIGAQIGGGRGQTAATIGGAAAGAYAGHEIQGRRRADNETFRVTVRLDSGSYQTVTQENISDLRTGDRVRVDGNQIVRI